MLLCSSAYIRSISNNRPVKTRHSVVPSRRMEDKTVTASQCPWGAASWQRAPFKARPYNRVILVFPPDSSRKIRRFGSSVFWNSAHTPLVWAISRPSCSLARRVFLTIKLIFFRSLWMAFNEQSFAKCERSSSHVISGCFPISSTSSRRSAPEK